jgi:hypothetical protein
MKAPFIIWLILFPFFLHAQEDATSLLKSTRGEVQFISEAPLELIKASSDELRGLIDPANHTFAFIIPNRSFKGFNSRLQQEHFYENYIEAEKYTSSTFEGKIIEKIDFSSGGNHTIRAKGKLNIHGVIEERVIKIDFNISNGTINILAQFDVILTDHNITIPKMVYQKIAETIHVKVEMEFVKNE